MSKQDRQGVRKASDIEQKYNLSLLSQMKGGNQNVDLSKINQVLTQFMVETNAKFEKMHSVGSIHVSLNDTNPSNLFGGEWELLAEGYILLGLDSGTLPQMIQSNDKCFVWKRIS